MKSKRKPVVVGIGELLWDIFPEGKKAGGAPVNFVYHATAMGANGHAISAVGDDKLGNEIIGVIDSIGINYFISKVEYPTGTVKVQFNQGAPFYEIAEGVAWDYIPLSSKVIDLARKTDAVSFGTLAQRCSTSKENIRKFLSLVPDDSFRILDINLRAPFYSQNLIEESLRLCNVLKLNNEELEILKEMFSIKDVDLKDVCNQIISNYNLKYLILTAGADYSMIFSSTDFSFIKTPKVKVVDTVGAGDAFTGAFAVSLIKGLKVDKAHSIAVERAAAVCEVAGAWGEI